jgi:hypothetical protein
MSIRTVEQSAPATLAELIPQLTMLTTDQPTTAEIEEALIKIVPAITRALADWLRSRHEIGRDAHLAAVMDRPVGSGQIPATPTLTALVDAFADHHQRDHAGEIPVENEAEREYLDQVESAHPHIFAPDLTPMEKPA